MILRLALFALMALGLVGFGTVAWISSHPPATRGTGRSALAASHDVLVAARDLRAGTLLKADDLAARKPGAADFAGNRPTIADSSDARRGLVGGMVRRPLIAGDILRPHDVLRPGDHGFLAAVLRPGMRAVTVGVDPISGTAGLIWPGDRVDLILTQSIADPSLPLGRRVAAETVLQNTRVIAIDQQLVEGADPGVADGKTAHTVTLEVTGEQVERVQVAARIGRLSLAVRAAEQPNHRAAARPLEPVWAGDVSHALSSAPAPAPNIMRLYRGTAAGKEFHF
ncbi:MAG TPA: Flp pilus assembly protein CpaB [Acetobacteraceae bacterium]|nr:Flp pilus assembly protein CpaB [Acetobacteraceae bacterium]